MINYHKIQAAETDDALEPVTRTEAKAWAVIEHDDDDSLLLRMMTAAREDVEQETNRKLVPHSVTVIVSYDEGLNEVALPYGPVKDLTVAAIENGSEISQTILDDYQLQGSSVLLSDYGTFKVTYTTDYTVPKALKEAILMLVTYRYKNRGDQEKQQGLPEDIAHRLSKYRAVWL